MWDLYITNVLKYTAKAKWRKGVRRRAVHGWCNDPCELGLAPWNHKEAIRCIMLHATHAAHNGQKILIHIVDTDVVVLAVVLVCTLKDETEVWISFSTGHAFHFLAAHEIARLWVLRKFRQI